ncbi:MAG: acetate--CoA ligase family protein [Burkholderiaceae bacterium]
MVAGSASLEPLFNPRSVAIVGASNDPAKIGGIPLSYFIKYGFDGPIHPVNPNYPEIQGLKASPSLSAIGEPVDMAVFAVPARQIPAAIEDAAQAGVRAAVMFSSGFAELGDEGAIAQAALTKRAAEAGIRLLGPNCLGFMSIRRNLYATFTPAMQRAAVPAGRIAIVSQSGAFGAYALQLARRRGLGLSYWVTTGNEGDIQLADCIDWLADDPDTDVMLCYMEGCRDGTRLRAALARAQDHGKRLVIIKIGRTEAGSAAAASHTAALSGEDAVYDALFAQSGVWRAQGIEEFFSVGYAAATASMPAAGRLGIMTVSGGVGALMADDAASLDLSLPRMPQAAQQELRELVPFCAPGNPVDVTGQFQNDHRVFDRAFDLMAESGLYDGLAIFTAASGLSPVFGPRVRDSLLAGRARHPGLATALVTLMDDSDRQQLDAAGILCFEDPGTAVRALAALRFFTRAAERHAARGDARPAGPAAPRIDARQLNEQQALTVIAGAGIGTVDVRQAGSEDSAAQAAAAIGYPVVLKILSADIGHKSDVGGVRVGLADESALRSAYREMLVQVGKACPQARLDGVLVAPMISAGVEMIIGSMQDPVFGPVVLCGLGGVTAEALRDTAIRVAPIDAIEARAMVDSLRGRRLLDGMRGAPPADVDALVQAIVALSDLAVAGRDTIESIDVNPLRVLPRGQGVLALDALVLPRTRIPD